MPDTEQNIKSALDAFSFLSDVHVVGGAVRDMLVGRQSDDIDLATSDTPEEAMAKCRERGFTVIETGIQHGTVTAVSELGEFEITTFRKDVSTDGRNATVEWAEDIEEDLQRRDFTINAMAAREADGEPGENEFVERGLTIVDPFGGRSDIEDGIVTAAGDPRTRFKEDLLRIVRAIRFSARFDFAVNTVDFVAMDDMADQVVENVSVERIVMEIEKAFKDDNPAAFLTAMDHFGLIEDVLGAEIGEEGFMFSSARLSDPWHRMIGFVLGIEKGSELDFDELQSRLRLSNGLVFDARAVSDALEFLMEHNMPESGHMHRRFWHEFGHVMEATQAVARQNLGAPAAVFEEPDVETDPVVTGADFIERGHEEGPVIGELVDAAHSHQLRHAETDRQTLIQEAETQVS